jgi:hypothetical protein
MEEAVGEMEGKDWGGGGGREREKAGKASWPEGATVVPLSFHQKRLRHKFKEPAIAILKADMN